MFRDPIDRLISFYRFQRAHPAHGSYVDRFVPLAHSLSPEEFFTHEFVRNSPRVNNAYLRVFGSSHYAPLPKDRSENEAAFALARDRIASLDAVGITEAMDESIVQCCRILGRDPAASFEAKQRTDDLASLVEGFRPVEPVRRTEQLLAMMADLVAYDQGLYAIAKTAFERQRNAPVSDS